MTNKVYFRRDTAAGWVSANPTLMQGEIGYESDRKRYKIGDGATAWVSLGYIGIPVLPAKNGDLYNREGMNSYINSLAIGGNYSASIVAYTHGATCISGAYVGGVYSPAQNRIYFVPRTQATVATWHYVDCSNGSIVAYTHGATAVNGAYWGGVYSPTQNRIYFVPRSQSTAVVWHYVDCSNGSIVAYTHGATVVAAAYVGGVYSPAQNRIYFIPYTQSTAVVWHYVDCSNGSIVAYTHGATVVATAYFGGVYSPAQNRIYMVPSSQTSSTTWHYIDCSVSSVLISGYSSINSFDTTTTYSGGVYSPTQNRIYFVPATVFAGSTTMLAYIDCNTGSALYGAAWFYNSAGNAPPTYGCVYSPIQNRIYVIPQYQATRANWQYVDCNTGSWVNYTHGITAVGAAYAGGVYSPTQNRIYMPPYTQATAAVWHYIDCDPGTGVYPSKWLMAGPIFNKY